MTSPHELSFDRRTYVYIYIYIHSAYSQRKITILALSIALYRREQIYDGRDLRILASLNPHVGNVPMITLCYPRLVMKPQNPLVYWVYSHFPIYLRTIKIRSILGSRKFSADRVHGSVRLMATQTLKETASAATKETWQTEKKSLLRGGYGGPCRLISPDTSSSQT